MGMDPWVLVLPPLALALLLGHVLGHGAARLGVPQVTVYLLMGILVGPHGLAALEGMPAWSEALTIGHGDHESLKVLEHIAIGFILYRVGTEFRFADLRRIGPRIVALSLGEVLLTGGLVFLAVWSITGNLIIASIAPILATSSAPSATLLTLREVEAEGRASNARVPGARASSAASRSASARSQAPPPQRKRATANKMKPSTAKP